MNRFATPFLSILFSLAIACSAAFGTTYYSQGNVSPNATSNWNSNPGGGGSVPSNFSTPNDIFIIQNTDSMSLSGGSWSISGLYSELRIFGKLNLATSTSTTVGFCVVQAGGQLWLMNGAAMTVNNGSSVAGPDMLVAGAFLNYGTFTYGSGAAGQVTSTGSYYHRIDGGTLPLFEWIGSAKCVVDNITTAGSISGLNQSFQNFTWNSGGQINPVQFNSQLTSVGGLFLVKSTGSTGSIVLFNSTANLSVPYFEVENGIVDFTTTGSVFPTVTISDNGTSFDLWASGTIRTSGSGSKGTFVFTAGDRSIQQLGTIGSGVGYHFLPGSMVGMKNNLITVTGDMEIDSGAFFGYNKIGDANNFQSFTVVGSGGKFKLNDYGSFYVMDDGGLATSGAAGAVRVTGVREFSPYGNYYYWNANMVTGSGLPDTVYGNIESWPLTLTLSKNLTLLGDLTIIDSPLNVGSFTLELGGKVIDSLINSTKGYFQSNSNGTIYFNSNSAGQKVLTNNSQYGNITFNNYPKSLPSGTMKISNVFTPGSANHSIDPSNTIDINGTGTQPVPGFRYAELNISKSAGTAVFPNISTDTVHISGTFTAGFSPTYDLTGSTVEFNSSTVSQFTGHFDYNNLVLRNTYAKVSIGAAITVNGLLDVGGQGLTLGATNTDYVSEMIVR
ncbi:MAG: hypothetical protein ACOYNS_17630, partial [Bacteroidota bacterium]